MEKVFENSDLVSVVIPVYNVKDFLEKCIESVVQQTYKNIEILLIDDGSTDGSDVICDKYCKKDNRIKVFHKKNGGLSDARNYGISKSTGKFITFIDSDDYVSDDYVEYLYELLIENKTNISACGHFILKNGKTLKKNIVNKKRFTKTEALNAILYDREIDICSWGKLYNKKLFDDIRFPKEKIFEDTGTTFQLFDKCDYISVGDECKYYYIIRSNSITTKEFNIKKMDLIEMTNNMCEYIIRKYPNLRLGCNRRTIWAYMSTYTKIVFTPKSKYIEEKKLIKNYIKNNRKIVLKDKNISRRDRLSLIIFLFGDNIFKIIWQLYKKI